MKVIEREIGRWIKDGVRYGIRKDEDQTRDEVVTEAEAAGYVLDPIDQEVRDLYYAKIKKKYMIKLDRINDYTQNITSSDGLEFKTDLSTIMDVVLLIQNLSEDGVYPQYKCADGTYHNISKTEFETVLLEGMQRKGAAFAKEQYISTLIDTASTVSGVEQINW